MKEALMTKFENSNSFIDARENIKLIEMIIDWNEALTNRLEVALNNNVQIKGAFGVEGRVKIF